MRRRDASRRSAPLDDGQAGASRETDIADAERAGRGPATGRTRAQALRAAIAGGAIVGAGALVGGWAGPEATDGRPSRTQDVRILNFLLVLEELQAAFYAAALRRANLSGDLLQFARTVAPQEREHAGVLRRALGDDAQPVPRFALEQATAEAARFKAAAIDLEETVVAAYIGQGASLTRDAIRDVTRIVSVEARHAGWILDIAGANPAPRAADPARSADDVLSDLRRGGFLR